MRQLSSPLFALKPFSVAEHRRSFGDRLGFFFWGAGKKVFGIGGGVLLLLLSILRLSVFFSGVEKGFWRVTGFELVCLKFCVRSYAIVVHVVLILGFGSPFERNAAFQQFHLL